MAFNSFSEFLAMGGHAPYIWTAYCLTSVLILYILAAPVLRQRQFVRAERQRQLRNSGHSEAQP